MRITGRKKEILVTAGGKNVAPAVLEDRVRAHPLVSQCLVVGDGRPFIAALVTLDPDAARAVGRGARQDRLGRATWSTTPTCAPRSRPRVDEANRSVSQAESIRRFASCPATGPRRRASSPRASSSSGTVVMQRVPPRGRRPLRLTLARPDRRRPNGQSESGSSGLFRPFPRRGWSGCTTLYFGPDSAHLGDRPIAPAEVVVDASRSHLSTRGRLAWDAGQFS